MSLRLLLLVPAIVALGVPAVAQEVGADADRRVLVTGRGHASARPDVVVVTLGVHTEAESAAAALEENNRRMSALIATLKKAGVETDDIRTQGLNLSPRWGGHEQGEPRVIGYAASNTVEARLRALDRAGAVLDAAVQAGGNTIQGVSFELADPSALRSRAREAAMKDARATAEQLASLAGAALGPVLVIEATEAGGRPGPQRAMAMMVSERAADVPLEPGTQKVEATVDVTWALEPVASR